MHDTILVMASAFVVVIFLDAARAQLAAGLGLSVWVILHFPLYDKIGFTDHTKWTRVLNIGCVILTSFFTVGTVAVTLLGFIHNDIPNIAIGIAATVVLILSLCRQIPEISKRSEIHA